MDPLIESLRTAAPFHAVVPFDPCNDKLLLLDFTAANIELTSDILNDSERFTRYVNEKLDRSGARYGIGGYGEHRTVYSVSAVFDGIAGTEPRRLHLGIDIWGPAGTEVMAPLDGRVHSFAFNSAFGDYGATIILMHNLNGVSFYTLYGHLTLDSLMHLQEGRLIRAGEVFTAFGPLPENGYWPPHLHFQVIRDMQGMKGDYPGVCAYSLSEQYLANCPNPDLILDMMKYGQIQNADD